MKLNIIKVSILALGGLFSISAQGQDLMARQANMDKQLKAVDSVSLQRSYHKEISQMVSNIYSSWTHDHVNAYRNEQKPAYFKIDLRGFSMPTPSRIVTSNYGYRRSFGRNHYGLDIKVYTGDTICAAFSGKVRIVAYDAGGFGYYVVIRHPNGLETVYGHLSKQLVHEDEMVHSGEPIGLGGSTGHSTGSHLHFETRLLGESIDPSLMFNFPAQDVTGDYYVYHNDKPFDMAQNDESGDGDNEVASVPANSSEKVIAQDVVNMDRPLYHKVKRGDTLYSIARESGLSVKELCNLNGLSSRARLRSGQILKCQ